MNTNTFKKQLHEHKMLYAAIQSFSCFSSTPSITVVLIIQFKNYILLKNVLFIESKLMWLLILFMKYSPKRITLNICL